jgi:hypothetical protein
MHEGIHARNGSDVIQIESLNQQRTLNPSQQYHLTLLYLNHTLKEKEEE